MVYGKITKEEYERRQKLFEQGMKVCYKCKEEKTLDSFSKDKTRKDGYQYSCKECGRRHREANKEYQKEYYEKNKEKVKQRYKKHYEKNKEKLREYDKKYREENKEKLSEYGREYNKKYYEKNKEKVNEYQKEYIKKRKQQDPAYKLRCHVSSIIAITLKRGEGSKRGESIMSYLPYTAEQLKEHLESKWAEGMSWQNYGEWHIDHIYPQSKLPYDTMSHPNFLKCWALKNLQPLWAEENIRKSNKLLD